MPDATQLKLSRRERQIMEILYSKGRATVAEVRAAMHDAPSYSAVRATLRILEEKGSVRHEDQAGTYIYTPRVSRTAARLAALRTVVKTFFAGSPADAAAALLGSSSAKLTEAELDRLAELIAKSRKNKS